MNFGFAKMYFKKFMKNKHKQVNIFLNHKKHLIIFQILLYVHEITSTGIKCILEIRSVQYYEKLSTFIS